MNNRLVAVIDYYELSPSEFADKIQVPRSSISHITSGRNKPGVDLLQKVLKSFPNVNSEWLLLGRGEMLKDFENETIPPLFSNQQQAKSSNVNSNNLQKEEDKPVEKVLNGEKDKTQAVEKEYQQASAVKLNMPQHKQESKIKRITIYFDDNSYQDFIPE